MAAPGRRQDPLRARQVEPLTRAPSLPRGRGRGLRTPCAGLWTRVPFPQAVTPTAAGTFRLGGGRQSRGRRGPGGEVAAGPAAPRQEGGGARGRGVGLPRWLPVPGEGHNGRGDKMCSEAGSQSLSPSPAPRRLLGRSARPWDKLPPDQQNNYSKATAFHIELKEVLFFVFVKHTHTHTSLLIFSENVCDPFTELLNLRLYYFPSPSLCPFSLEKCQERSRWRRVPSSWLDHAPSSPRTVSVVGFPPRLLQ